MKKIFYFFPALLLLISSCSSDSETEGGNDSETILSSFDGTFRSGENTFSGTGLVEVSDNEFTFTTQHGTLTGEAMLETDDQVSYFELDITEGTGIFNNTSQMSGEMYNDYINIQGNDDSGGTLEVSGELMTLEEFNQQWRDDRTKSSVVFTNVENCPATVTINGETLGPIDTHYEVNGLCNPVYDGWRSLPADVDHATSTLFCNDITLEMLDGSMQTFESCYVATFVLDKKTDFQYTVEWANGESTSGSFTSPDGGKQKFICLENDGIECSTDESGSKLIETNTIEIDYAQSSLPSGDEELLPFIDESAFGVYSTTMQNDNFGVIVIGEYISPDTPDGYSDTRMRIYVRNGVANSTYEIETWSENAPIGIDVDFGTNGVPYNNTAYPTSGTIVISNYDENTNSCTITFQEVEVSIDVSWGSNYTLVFSGEIGGTFSTD